MLNDLFFSMINDAFLSKLNDFDILNLINETFKGRDQFLILQVRLIYINICHQNFITMITSQEILRIFKIAYNSDIASALTKSKSVHFSNLDQYAFFTSDSTEKKSIKTLKAIDLVQQFTIIQHHLFKKIDLSELISFQYRNSDVCPNISILRSWNDKVF